LQATMFSPPTKIQTKQEKEMLPWIAEDRVQKKSQSIGSTGRSIDRSIRNRTEQNRSDQDDEKTVLSVFRR
jgi:hypothetical protein